LTRVLDLDAAMAYIMRTSLPDKAAIAATDLVALASEILSVLRADQFACLPDQDQSALLLHVVALYAASWHESANDVAHAAQPLFLRLVNACKCDLDLLVRLYDGMLFLHWCTTHSIEAQRTFAGGVVTPFVKALTRGEAMPPRPALQSVKKLRIAYLGQFCFEGGGNALGLVAMSCLQSLVAIGRYDVFLYAWLYHAPAFLDSARSIGATVRDFPAMDAATRLDAISDQMKRDEIDVVITDMNSAVPTALFLRRVAPVQIYLQLGLPFWPVPTIDSVMLGWHVEPSRIGFAAKQCHAVVPPWDIAALNPAVDALAVERERALFPAGQRIIGMYGRLAKVTPEYLEVAARLVSQHPDVVFAIGGSGDAAPIRRFVIARGLQDRFVIVDRFVDGHLWGHLLELFLDTWPLHGGYAVREVMAKGIPAISMMSDDMPNLSREKDPKLIATTPQAYEDLANRLLREPAWRQTCGNQARSIAQNLSERRRFSKELESAITKTVWRAATWPEKLRICVGWLRA
jgi:hypothetical protein